ncbi:MAG TPA: (Fe-S)-binding protein [Desulfomicrobiaceae bacterium]|nr:(Fe-S)-binding protein [Desulfomicrobiaceae bacterium]
MKFPKNTKTVYYFGTCLIDMCYPESGLAGINLLKREGLEVVFPMDQTCCGQPAYNSGFRAEAKAVARKQVEVFSEHDWPIIVPSGSCAGMMRYHYPQLFKDDPDYFKVRRFSERVFELTQFLNRGLNVSYKDKGTPLRLAWHSSCHARTEMACIEDSKSLIGQLSNVTLVPIENEHECCGFGGTFSVKQPEISAAMVRDKADAIARTGVDLFLTGDCGCMMNIAGYMEKQKMNIRGRHIADFLWERING